MTDGPDHREEMARRKAEEQAKNEQAARNGKIGCLAVVGVIVVGAVVLSVVADDDSDGLDAPARLACAHFSNVMADTAAGTLSLAELRGKIQEVHRDARLSDTPGVAPSSQAMLSAVTRDDVAGFGEASQRFRAACRG